MLKLHNSHYIYLSAPYFVSFVFLSQSLLLNLLTGVVVRAFDFVTMDKSILTKEELLGFDSWWGKFDKAKR